MIKQRLFNALFSWPRRRHLPCLFHSFTVRRQRLRGSGSGGGCGCGAHGNAAQHLAKCLTKCQVSCLRCSSKRGYFCCYVYQWRICCSSSINEPMTSALSIPVRSTSKVRGGDTCSSTIKHAWRSHMFVVWMSICVCGQRYVASGYGE